MKWTIGIKIILGFSLALLIQCAIGVISYRTVVQLVENASQVSHTHEVLSGLESLISLLKDAETGQRGYLLIEDEKYLNPYQESLVRIEARLGELRRLTSDNRTQQTNLDELNPLIDQKLAELKQTVDLTRKKQRPEALKLVATDAGREAMVRIRSLISKMEDEENRLLDQRSQATQQDAALATNFILYGTLTAFVVVGLAGLVLQQSITRPLRAFMGFVDRIGQGDLTQEAVVNTNDEVGSLGLALNKMVKGLRDLGRQVRSAAEDLNAAASQILATSQEQAAGTREQAAAVQQITTTIDQVNQSGNQIADKAREVASSAEATSSATTVGLQSVQEAGRTVQALREQVEAFAEHIVILSEKTQAVGEIITAVNEIAERSNLLALNAAIEAAGAGEQGSRFGVVAGEMKNLADQAKESTVQVQGILIDIQKGINNSVMLTEEAVKRAEAGSHQAETTEHVIRQMADTTQASIQVFQQIIAGTGQQRIGFMQVTQGMKDIRQAAEQTAQAVSQLEAAVRNVTNLSRQLQSSVGRYKL